VIRRLKLSTAALATVVLASVLLVSPASPASAVKATNDGHKHISVSQKNGKIIVKWKPTLGVKYFLVKTSSTPDMSQNVKSYKVSKKKTTVTVKPTKYAVAGTGNYTFVRVYAVKKGKVGVSPYKQVRMVTAAPAAGLSAETVATFNVKTAEAPEIAGHTWSQRIGAVASQIQQSNAAVIALEEAGASGPTTGTSTYTDATGNHNKKDFYWQFEQLRDSVGGNYQLASSDEYAPGEGALGKEGTRILYDTSKVTLLQQGFFAPSAVDKYLRFVPWAQFQDNATGKKFYFIAAHLDNRDSEYKLRLKQIASVIAKVKEFSATGEQVILAGDMNSNIYSRPYNAVDQALITAGFFDSYSTANNTNEFYVTFNDFSKPKKSASRTDYIMTYGKYAGSYSYKDWIVKSGTIPSDHYMQTATVPIG
jgi:endonuclease/exonuclease/phosphatase family metal-dependent hydrolase